MTYAPAHNMKGHPAHASWRGARERCYNVNHVSYDYYGGRGIRMCPEWHSFCGFWEDMGGSFSDGMTLDRIDNDGGYSPDNCQWVSRAAQCRNQRTNLWIIHNSERVILKDACAAAGVRYSLLKHRYHIYRRDNENETPTLEDLLSMDFPRSKPLPESLNLLPT